MGDPAAVHPLSLEKNSVFFEIRCDLDIRRMT
jgi:hypothetical protein